MLYTKNVYNNTVEICSKEDVSLWVWGSNSLVARWKRISRGDFLRIWPAQARLGSNYQRYAQQVWWQKARAGSLVVEQLALHGPVKDDQTVVAATTNHIPFTWRQWWTQTMQIWAPRTKPINLVLGQRQPSGKSRDVDANAEDADRCKLLWLTTTLMSDRCAAGRQLAPFGRTYKDFTSRTPPLPPSKDTSSK